MEKGAGPGIQAEKNKKGEWIGEANVDLSAIGGCLELIIGPFPCKN